MAAPTAKIAAAKDNIVAGLTAASPRRALLIAVPNPLNTVETLSAIPTKTFLTAEPADFAMLAKPVNGLGILGNVGLNLLNGLGIFTPFNFISDAMNNPIPTISGANAPALIFSRAFLIESSAGWAIAFNLLNAAVTALTAPLTMLRNFSELL